jgi:hypothetical protein
VGSYVIANSTFSTSVASSASAFDLASSYRALDAGGFTLLIGEADTFMEGQSALIGILNSGDKRSNA